MFAIRVLGGNKNYEKWIRSSVSIFPQVNIEVKLALLRLERERLG